MPRHLESRLQSSCKTWFDLQHNQYAKLLFAVPNGGARSVVEAKIMKGEGVVAGVSDMILLVPRGRYASLCIEFKTKTGKQTQLQKELQKTAEENGNRYVVVRSIEDFVREINAYLRL